MKLPQIIWQNKPLFKKTPLIFVVAIVAFIAFNVYLNLKIKTTSQELAQIEKSAVKPPREVDAAFAKRTDLGIENCPSVKAGNPEAPLKFKLFTSETCPFCVAEDKVLDELLPQYGDLIYGEWYQVTSCPNEAEKYQISGVPTFVFNANGEEKPPAYGFLDAEQLIDYICRVSQKC